MRDDLTIFRDINTDPREWPSVKRRRAEMEADHKGRMMRILLGCIACATAALAVVIAKICF